MEENIALIASSNDEAGMNMVNFLTINMDFKMTKRDPFTYVSSLYQNVRLYLTNRDLLFLDDYYYTGKQPTSFIFLSRHRSASGIPSLTCHSTGNFSDDTSYGGKPGELGMVNPSMLKAYLNELSRNCTPVPEYEITLEATHHGPTSLKGSVIFVEIGSGPEQWRDANAARVVCNSILKACSLKPRSTSRVALVLGGTHYPEKVNKLLIETDFSVAYIATKNNLQFVDYEMIQQMQVRSTERITHVLLDWKGLGKYKRSVLDAIEKTDLEIVKI